MKNAGHEDELIPLEKHTTYYSVAYTSFLEVKRLERERVRYQRTLAPTGKELTDDDIDFLAMNAAQQERSAIVTVVFSALTLEAFVNDYGISNSSRSYFKNYLDKLSVLSKWLLLPKLFVGKTFRTDGQTFQSLAELFRQRDKLVHFKSSIKRLRDINEGDWVTDRNASDAVRTVREVVAKLKRLDGSVSTYWLSESERPPVERTPGSE